MSWRKHIERLLTSRSRYIFIVVGLAVGVGSFFFTASITGQLKEKEKNEVMLWSYAMSRLGEINSNDFLVRHILDNQTIPFIMTDEHGHIMESNLIADKILSHPDLRNKKIVELSAQNQPLEINARNGTRYLLFFGNSRLLKVLIYFPYILMLVVVLFFMFGFITFRSSKQDEQNRVWIGLAKETAHQLGTPISSLLGWIEYLRSQPIDQTAVEEMNKDLTRLVKVADRFSKIGSETVLSQSNVNETVGGSVIYFRTRIPRNVTLDYNGFALAPVEAMLNSALFEWVVENLLKNALDALQGEGAIDVVLSSTDDWVHIDVKDTGKGIAKSNYKRIFEPGFTTKTRGWGLGLSLSKRIIEEYHHGRIFVLESEQGRGTTIRISVRRTYS